MKYHTMSDNDDYIDLNRESWKDDEEFDEDMYEPDDED